MFWIGASQGGVQALRVCWPVWRRGDAGRDHRQPDSFPVPYRLCGDGRSAGASQLDELENSLSTVLRTLKEGPALCRDLAAKRRRAANVRAAQEWQKKAV